MSVMQLDEVARQRQAESGAATPRAASLLGLVELVEDALQLVGGDADALVCDVDAHSVGVGHRHVDGHRPAARRELDGVRQQIEEDLLQAPFVEPYARHGGERLSWTSSYLGQAFSLPSKHFWGGLTVFIRRSTGGMDSAPASIRLEQNHSQISAVR